MSERIISISPYVKADNLIDLQGYISINEINEKIEIPARKHLILFHYLLSNNVVVVPRDYETFRITLKPMIAKTNTINDFSHLLLKGESIEKVLKLKLQVSCRNTRWCSDQLSIDLRDVSARKEIFFDIPLSEVKEEIIISGYVTRENGSNIKETRKASSIFSVLSNCENISIQVDERKEIGGNHFPIDYEDLANKDMVFDIKGIENDFELPRIKCAKEFKEFFVRDDLKTVNSTFLMAMFYFLDSYLKWLIFNCKFDTHDKNHKGLVETFSKYCGISKSNLIELIEEKKYSENQTKQYLSLSHNLLIGLQVDSSVKYAKELKQMLKEETK